MLLLRGTRWPLAARLFAPTTAIYRPAPCSPHAPLSARTAAAFSTGNSHAPLDKPLSPAQRVALLPPTVAAFHARHGHFVMTSSFAVPTEDDSRDNPHLPPYPVEARGLRLGTTLYRLLVNATSRRKYSDAVQALGSVGFPVDVDWEQYIFERQRVAAFRVYRELHGDCLMPLSFVVPTDDPRWPIETRGFRLGKFASDFRNGTHRLFSRERLAVLAELGLSWELNELPLTDRLPLLAPTLKAFHARHGHIIMPSNFAVPADDSDAHFPPYPVEARGLRLGATLYRIFADPKSRRKYSHVLHELEAVGFPVDVDWKQYVFEHQRLAALRTYREVYGDCSVPRLFEIPTDDARWPIETRGFKLGDYVRNVQHRDKRHLTQTQRDQLNDLGFPWGRHHKRRSNEDETNQQS